MSGTQKIARMNVGKNGKTKDRVRERDVVCVPKLFELVDESVVR
jgi:hypothetical protein